MCIDTEASGLKCTCPGVVLTPTCNSVTSNSCTATDTGPGECKCGSNAPCTTGNMCNADGTCSEVEGKQRYFLNTDPVC